MCTYTKHYEKFIQRKLNNIYKYKVLLHLMKPHNLLEVFEIGEINDIYMEVKSGSEINDIYMEVK